MTDRQQRHEAVLNKIQQNLKKRRAEVYNPEEARRSREELAKVEKELADYKAELDEELMKYTPEDVTRITEEYAKAVEARKATKRKFMAHANALLEKLDKQTAQLIRDQGGQKIRHCIESIDCTSISHTEDVDAFNLPNFEDVVKEEGKSLPGIWKPVEELWHRMNKLWWRLNRSMASNVPNIIHTICKLSTSKDRVPYLRYYASQLKESEQMVVFTGAKEMLNHLSGEIDMQILDNPTSNGEGIIGIKIASAYHIKSGFYNGSFKILVISGEYDCTSLDTWRNVRFIIHADLSRPVAGQEKTTKDPVRQFHMRNEIALHSTLPDVSIYTFMVSKDDKKTIKSIEAGHACRSKAQNSRSVSSQAHT